jgi:diaminopimelate epimerase
MHITKMQGIGNDFIVVDAAAAPSETDWPRLAVPLCKRRLGIGADGLLVAVRAAEGADFAMRMFNPDGTEDMCGNGLRCIGLWAHHAGRLPAPADFTVSTKEGARQCRLIETAADGRSASLRVNMGFPRLKAASIPFCASPDMLVINHLLPVCDRTFPITSVNTGSTHTVIFGETPDEEDFQRFSPLIENHPLFPERTSVLWATPAGLGRFTVRIWERGVGETLGCGTGACAVGVAARLHGLTGSDGRIEVLSKGGALQVNWPAEDADIQMTGPAQIIFEGEIDLAEF